MITFTLYVLLMVNNQVEPIIAARNLNKEQCEALVEEIERTQLGSAAVCLEGRKI